MSKLIVLSCLLFFRATYVVSLSLCDSSTYLEVKEGQNNTFVCTGLTIQPDVYFYWETSILLSTCTITSCSNDEYPEYFQFRRTEAISSKVTVYPGTYPDLDSLAKTSLSCQQGSAANRVTCQLDVVYPAEDPKCQIQFSGDTWQVTGWCTVSKFLSRRNRYGCLLYQISQTSSALVANVTMGTRPTAGSVYCQINTALPPEGKYNYSVIIIPGGVEVFPSFIGSNEIRRPSVSPQHNCSQTVTEGEDVNCVCFTDHLGLPSGYVVWARTNSSKLKIEKVNRNSDGTTNTCVLMWNNTAVQNVTITIAVNYASRVLSFKIDNKTDDAVNVNENRNVSAVCQAEGKPLPKLRLYKRGSNNQNITISDSDSGETLLYTINVVNCEDAYTYFCKSENSISSDERYIRLTVSCSPKKTTNDSYLTTFVDGAASLMFKMNAYPPPSLLLIFYNGSATNSIFQKIDHENTVKSTCSSDTPISYMITCTVTLLNETIYAIGLYTVTFNNTLGNISFAFEVKEKLQITTNTMQITDSPSILPGAIVGGVIGGVVFIALTVVIIIFIVRRKGKRSKGPSLPNNAGEEDFSEEQNNREETPREVYAIVEKKDPKPTTASTITDVYADVVKKGTERTEVDFPASSPTPDVVTKDKKGKISKTPGKGKKKGKGDRKPLSANNTGIKSGAGALSMSPMTDSEYENCGFDEKEHEKERKGAKEIQRRGQQGLNYTTVVFDNTAITPTPPPVLETTEYAEIVPRQKPAD